MQRYTQNLPEYNIYIWMMSMPYCGIPSMFLREGKPSTIASSWVVCLRVMIVLSRLAVSVLVVTLLFRGSARRQVCQLAEVTVLRDLFRGAQDRVAKLHPAPG